jgi:arylsulfatase A-like enzyme
MRKSALALLSFFTVLLVGCEGSPTEENTNTTPPVRQSKSKTDETYTNSSAALSFKDYNIIFVSFDALQAAHVGALGYGRDVTPTIDALAETGFNFRNNTSVASWTVPASMTWFTGVYPSEHRMTNKYAVYRPPEVELADVRKLAPALTTLADVLRENGYSTVGFTGNAGVSGGFGYAQGFDEYYFEPGKFGSMDDTVPRALKWLKENKEKKFFLFLHGYDVHGQCMPAGGFDYRFVDKDYDGRFTGNKLEQELLREEGLEKGKLSLREQDVNFWRAIYDEKIQRQDKKFAQFVRQVRDLGLMDKTIFILTSDHGTELLEHQRMDHGFTLYQELIHVPLIIKTPEQGGKNIDTRISSIDVMPTILDLVDVPIGEKLRRQLRGRSLTPLMREPATATDVFTETDYREFTFKRAIISPDNWKLIYTLESNSRELYDLTADPQEMKDLSDTHTELSDKLQAKLFAHFKSLGSDLTERRWVPGLNPVYPSQAKP